MDFSRALICTFIVLLFHNSYALDTQVFSVYNTEMEVHSNNSIDINKKLKIKNIYDVGIIPADIEIEIGSKEAINILFVDAYDVYGNRIKSRVKEYNDATIVILDVDYPILPGFEHEFYVNYTLQYEPKGIFFKSLSLPIGDSSIPIEKGTFRISLPKGHSFTYVDASINHTELSKNEIVWRVDDEFSKQIVEFEYSKVPINVGNLKGSQIFWISINGVLLIILIFIIRMEVKKAMNEPDDK